MTECNGCGDHPEARCCSPVVLGYTQRMARMALPAMGIDPETRRWVIEDLIPIPRREGVRRAEYLFQHGQTFTRDPSTGEIMVIQSEFYECRHYDPDTKRCGNYARRPPVCRDYPWYGDPPDPQKAIPPQCSYNEDIPIRLRRNGAQAEGEAQGDGDDRV